MNTIDNPVEIKVTIDPDFEKNCIRINDIVRRAIREYMFKPLTSENIENCKSLISDLVEFSVSDYARNCKIKTDINESFTTISIERYPE